MKKRTIVILVIVLVLLVISVIILMIQNKKQPPISIEIEEIEETKLSSSRYNNYVELLTSEERQEEDLKSISLLINDVVVSPILSTNGDSIFYLSYKQDVIVQFSLQDKEQKTYFADDLLQSTEELIWSPDGRQVYLSTSKGFYLYGVTDSSVLELSKNIKDISFSLEGDRIAYQYLSYVSGENYLSVSNPDGSNWNNLVEIEPIEEMADRIAFGWFPGGRSVYYTNESLDISGTEFKKVDISSGNVSSLKDWGDLGEMLFIPSLSKILYVVFDEEKSTPQIWIMNMDGSDKKYTGVENFLSKCTVQHKSPILVCALSEDIFDIYSNDIIIEYNIETDEIKPITKFDSATSYNVNSIFLSQDDQKIFFLDNIDQKVYVVE